MVLPSDIKNQILEYLHLEYGEDPDNETSLGLEDIGYEGEFEIKGKLIHYFNYKSSSGRTWATVEPYGDSYCIGMTNSSPKPVTKKEIYGSVHVESLESDHEATIALESWGNGCFGLSDYKQISLTEKISFKLLVEVSSYSTPESVTVSIIDGNNEVYVSGALGVSMSYKSASLGEISITVGSGKWG